MKASSVVLRLLRLLLRTGWLFWGAFGLVSLASLFQPLRPYIYKYVIDHPLRSGEVSQLLWWGVLLVALTLLHAGVLRGQVLLTQKLAWAATERLRKQLFDKVLRLAIPTLDKYPSGLLYTRTLTDTQTLQSTLAETILVIAGEVLQLIFLVGLMFVVDPTLAALTLITMPIGLFTSRYFARKIRESFSRVRYYIARTNGFLQELFQGRETSDSLGLDSALWRIFSRLNRLYYSSYRRVIGYFALFFPAMELVTLLGLSLVLLVGSYLIYTGQSTIGALVAFTLYQQLFFRPFRIIADQVNSLQMGLVSAERIFALLDHPAEEPQGGQVPAIPPPYVLEIEGLRFGYDPEKPLFSGFSLRAEPGKVYSIVAPTGRGKSTLFYLLLGYYAPQAGKLSFGGLSLSEWDKQALRQKIAYIPQEPVLFEGTLRENLNLFREVPDAELWEAIERLGLRSYVEGWSLDQLVTASGAPFSAGEKQLIALWRAALQRPALWILDEPTAHIDPATEALLYSRLRNLAQDAIVLLVAHRPEAQNYSDETLYLPAVDAA